MSAFIKLHPHSLNFQRTDDGSFHADLSFSVEQYGLMVKDCLIKLQLFAPNQFHSHWWLVCEDRRNSTCPVLRCFCDRWKNMCLSRCTIHPRTPSCTARKRRIYV